MTLPKKFDLGRFSTEELAKLINSSTPVVVLIPVGSIEPHGPHLPLKTDTIISEAAALRAAEMLLQKGMQPLIAPAVNYGVTQCAAAFSGAVSIKPFALTSYLRSLITGYLANKVAHVSLINNHLEPAHDRAVRDAMKGFSKKSVSVATPLTRRWARTLSDEFKSGACHAGKYETSILLASDPELVDERQSRDLQTVPVSLSDKLKEGIDDFVAMGLTRAYSGTPADATSEHGNEQLGKLATMITTEVVESLNTPSDDQEITLDSLFHKPNAIAHHYSCFAVDRRILLTGHSHQAWPDCGFAGQQQAWLDAAEFVDEKWERAFAVAERVRTGFATLLEDSAGYYGLSSNTHDLVIRFLSALPIKQRPRLVTTDGEYHSIRRQLERLEEEGIEVVRVSTEDPTTVAERLMREINDQTAAVLVSKVLFRTGHIVSGLGELLKATKAKGAELLVDAYHAVNVVPFSIANESLEAAYVVGGGYKYCQLGEGNCFLRIPKDCSLRPAITGWYSEFSALTDPLKPTNVVYGQGGDRFAGSTYDPTSHYRAVEVFDFFKRLKLTPKLLRAVNQHQVGLLANAFDQLDLNPKLIDRDRTVGLEGVGGFLTLKSPKAGDICALLKEQRVYTDFRGDRLRLGPAPYHCDDQLTQAIQTVGSICRKIDI